MKNGHVNNTLYEQHTHEDQRCDHERNEPTHNLQQPNEDHTHEEQPT